MRYIKGLLGFHTVPANDSANNLQMRDVIGSKADTGRISAAATYSVLAYVKGLVVMATKPAADSE
jgi:hypothetical protein